MTEAADSTFDACKNEHYLQHLGEVSAQSACNAEQDIKNDEGALLVKKGTLCSQTILAQLTEHRLSRPIEESVNLTNCLSGKAIWADIHRTVEAQKDFFSLHEAARFSDHLRHLCLEKDFPRPLLQKLTVLKSQFSDHYNHTLQGAWLSALLAKTTGLAAGEVKSIFTAALFRDLGLLHIPVAMVNAASDDRQQRSLASHVLISAAVAEHYLADGKRIGTAIGEHHETATGSGLPAGKLLRDISHDGQFLSLAENLLSRRRQLALTPQSLALLTPFLRVHGALFPSPALRSANRLFSQAAFEPGCDELAKQVDKTALGNQVMERALTVCSILTFLVSADRLFQPSAGNRAGNRFREFLSQTLTLYRASGYVDIETLVVLHEEATSTESYSPELLEAEQTQLLFLTLARYALRQGKRLLKHKQAPIQQEAAPLEEPLRLLGNHLQEASFRSILESP